MTFYENLDTIMKQDFGGRGLLASLPYVSIEAAADSLMEAKRVILLTGFPVRMADGSFAGETDGPSGTANLAAALCRIGCRVSVVTDQPSAGLLREALYYRAPFASLTVLPGCGTEEFICSFIKKERPTHFISLERPGKAGDGHYHNMRGEVIDDMLADSAAFLTEIKKTGGMTISIGDGGNEMGMGTFSREIAASVPCGQLICTEESSDITLAGGVSNWWGWGIASMLSVKTEHFLLPSPTEETELLRRVVCAGGVDGCTKENTLTVDNLSLDIHLSVLESVSRLTREYMEKTEAAALLPAGLQ